MSVAGELGHFDLAGILQLLARNRATGRLRIAMGGDDIALYLEDGQLVAVTSARSPLRLGRMLRQRGLLNDRQLREALRQQEAEGGVRPLGAVLIDRGWVPAAKVKACAYEQCVAVLARALTAAAGTFTYLPDVRPSVRGLETALDTNRALLEALRRVDELARLRALLPPPHAPIEAGDLVDITVAARNEPEARVLSALRAGAGSWSELAELLPVDEATLLRTLVALRERGLVVAGAADKGVAAGSPSAPPPAEADLARMLDRAGPNGTG
jgi:hypothetical protein